MVFFDKQINSRLEKGHTDKSRLLIANQYSKGFNKKKRIEEEIKTCNDSFNIEKRSILLLLLLFLLFKLYIIILKLLFQSKQIKIECFLNKNQNSKS